jgi:hypothetical protein
LKISGGGTRLEPALRRWHLLQQEAAMTRRERRFQRQFDALERLVPGASGVFSRLRSNRWLPVRLPLALLLIAGGVFSFLPILGIWMLPLGLLLLAVDLPFLRGPISAFVIRVRVALRRLARRWRDRRKPP